MMSTCCHVCYVFYYLYLFSSYFFFFFIDSAPTEIYTLSLHDALPIFGYSFRDPNVSYLFRKFTDDADHRTKIHGGPRAYIALDRKSTRLNSSHRCISYAVFCLKKKKKKKIKIT